jgi:hypothetical protein
MINNNKILTVSYGTFSCTLEGFDDSFGTMKAIAEYFRDLSAGDRYFGAEPVQPDADMLAHIAQQEIARHVEARREDDGEIVLRAADVAAPAATAAAAALAAQTPSAPVREPVQETVQEPVQEQVQEIAPQPVAEAPAAPVEVAEVVETPSGDASFFVPPMPDEDFTPGYVEPTPAVDPASVLPPEDSIASKLQRIRAVVSRGDAPAMSDSFAEDEHSDTLLEDTAEDLEAALDADDAFAQTEDDEAEAAELDDVHALLGRLGDDEKTDAEAEADDLEDTLDAIEDEAPEVSDEITEEEAFEAAIEDDAAADDLMSDLEDDTADIDADDAVDARVVKVSNSDMDAALADGDIEEVYEDDDLDDGPIDLSAFAAEEGDSEDGTDDYIPSSLSADEEEALLRELAEVESSLVTEDEDDVEEMKASDEDLETMEELENEVQSYTSAAELYNDAEAEASDEVEAELEAEIEAELQDEVEAESEVEAELEDETSAYDIDADTSFEPEEEAEDDSAYVLSSDDNTDDAISDILGDNADEDGSDRVAARLGDADEDDLSRLMDKAATEMDEPDGSSRRDAFSHLRAAVAATKVDKILGRGKNEAEDQNAYRQDFQQDLGADAEPELDAQADTDASIDADTSAEDEGQTVAESIIMPRRPTATTSRTERPGTDRPAPLKLVAEQRIDLEDARPSGPVQPRRVAATVADPIAADASSFADYAESMGASKLPELLEAAASYMAYVEGRDQFSRPQLMTKVRQVEQDQFSREDGLRSFGQLLRAGKIEKIKGGRFTVSEGIGFKPDEREAG